MTNAEAERAAAEMILNDPDEANALLARADARAIRGEVGEIIEVVANCQNVEWNDAEPRWVRTRIERPVGVRFDGKAKVYVRVDGMLVTRQLRYTRGIR